METRVHITLSGHGTYSENGDRTAIPDGLNIVMYNKKGANMAFGDAKRLWTELSTLPYQVDRFAPLSDGSLPVMRYFVGPNEASPLEKLWIDKDYPNGGAVLTPWWGVWINSTGRKVYENEFPDGGRSLEEWLQILNSSKGRRKLGANDGDELVVHVICCREEVKKGAQIHDFDFLHEPMKKQIKLHQHQKTLKAAHSHLAPMMFLATGAAADDGKLDVSANMDIPEPVSVHTKGDMDEETFKAVSFTNSVCQNMIQKTIVDKAALAGVGAAEALKNMELWVQAYSTFPFPFYNFVDTQNDTYQKDDFSLTANPDVVENIVNIKGVEDLKAAVVTAVKNSGGELVKSSLQNRDFNYFGVITGYKATSIEVRLVKFQMHMEKTDVDTLCGGVQTTSLNSTYNTYMFTADVYMMKAMQKSVEDKLVDEMAKSLFEFADQFYKAALKDWGTSIADSIKKILKSEEVKK